MPDRVYGLTEDQLRRFVKQLIRDELEPRQDLQQRGWRHIHEVDHLAGTAYSTITAMSGGTPGTGQVQAKKFTSGTAADYAEPTAMLVDVLNFGPSIATGQYVVCHRHRESGKWAIDNDRSDIVSLQSANADTTLTGSVVVMGIGGASPVLPSWMTIVSNEIVISDAVIGKYLLFSGSLGIKRQTGPTTSNGAQISLDHYDAGGPGWASLWPGHCYLANDANQVQDRFSPTASWGPIKSGDKFRVTAQQTSGSDSIYFIGGVTDARLDIQLVNGVGYGTRSN